MLTALLILAGIAYPTVPGAINPAVTQANINETVCNRAWVKKQRPPMSYTEPLKLIALPKGHRASEYQFDHLVPLELGGDPRNPENLWLQPIREAHEKDQLENKLRELVCAELMPLTDAQQLIAGDWAATYKTIFHKDPEKRNGAPVSQGRRSPAGCAT